MNEYHDYDYGFDADDVCAIDEIDGVTADTIDLRTERVTLTKELDLNFVVQHLSARFSRLEPVEATVHATVGLELGWGGGYVCYKRGDISSLVVRFADGSTRRYTRTHIENSSDIEEITFLFYSDLRDLSEEVKQVGAVEAKLRELCLIV